MSKTINKKIVKNEKKSKTNTTYKNGNNPINNELKLEITSILIICLSSILIISIFFSGGGILGKFLSSILKGLFGIGAYILPILMITSCILIFFSEEKKVNILKFVSSIISFFLLISLFHIINKKNISSFSYNNYGEYLLNKYSLGGFFDGGVLGAIFGDIFLKILGNVGSYIVIILMFIGTIFILNEKSFFITTYKAIKNLSNYFYYEYPDKECYEEDIDMSNKREKNIFLKIKNNIKNKKVKRYVEDENINNYNNNKKYEVQHKKVFKKHNNYIFDGNDKYKKVPKPIFFDMNSKNTEQKEKKIIFAMDEINKSKNKCIENNNKIENNVPEFLKNTQNNNVTENKFYNNKDNTVNTHIVNNKNVNYTDENKTNSINDIYTTTANVDKDFENTYMNKLQNNFKNNYIKKGYTKRREEDFIIFESGEIGFDIDFDIPKKLNIEELFDNPPEEFLSENTDYNNLHKLDEFYDFNTNFQPTETFQNDDIKTHYIEDHEKYDDLSIKDENTEDILNYIYKDNLNEFNISENDDLNLSELKYELSNKNINENNNIPNHISNENIKSQNIYNDKYSLNSNYKIPEEDILQSIPEPIIIKAEKEKMIENTEAEKIIIKKDYEFPKLHFLSKNFNNKNESNDIELRENSSILMKTLKSFNVNAQVINISQGPSVTRYELSIEDGIKVSKILGLSDNLALSLAASSIRIEAPIPGKSAVGIEIPNKEVKSVFLSEVICVEKFQKFPSNIAFGLGKDITGNVIVTDIGKMPHMLIAGSTGSGKSVCINTLITSILYKANPNEVKLMMIDPKVVELSVYNGIPHLLTPVVTEPEKAACVLNWAVSEMMERYNLFAQTGTRNLIGYNQLKIENNEDKLPQIVIIIDELADLMMVAAKEVENSICRLAQLARAAGIHLIIATQRPSVDVITGLIKANIPSRIAFAVSSGTDSRTILDTVGAEKLLGKGDMLFRSVDMNKPLRIQGAFISDKEVEQIVTFIKENNKSNYDENIINKIENASKPKNEIGLECSDELTEEVISFLVKKGKASTSMIQRQFRIGYNRAARIIEELEDRGIVSSENGSKQRDVLMDKYQYEEYQNRYEDY